MNDNQTNLNDNTGLRLIWIRLSLDLAARRVARENNIPWQRFRLREKGKRVKMLEDFFTLSYYFDKKWQEKFQESGKYPKYCGKTIEEITPSWILFGVDRNNEVKKAYIAHIKKKFDEREAKLIEEKFKLEMELKKK